MGVVLLACRSKANRFRERRCLLEHLADEFQHGNSFTKLYISLLARSLVDIAPDLNATDEMAECGVTGYQPGRHDREVKRWHPLNQGKI